MFRKITLATAAAATLALVPATAEARHRDGYRDYGRYEHSYRGDRYGNRYYGNRNGYYGRNAYYGSRNYRYGRRCSGTTGTIVGGVAGALLGREVTRNRRNSGTTGAILGGAIGALAGRSIDKSGCRR